MIILIYKGWKVHMKENLVKTLNGMAIGLFATLVVGTILSQIGSLIHWNLLTQLGNMAKVLMGIMTIALASWLAAILWVDDMRMWAVFVIVTAARCTCYDVT